MDRTVGSDYSVVPDTIMNTALVQFGYPKDAILTRCSPARSPRISGTRVVVTSTLAKAPDGNRVMVARLTGTNDDAGNTVRVPQSGGQALDDLAARTADALQPAVRSLADARACMDQRMPARRKPPSRRTRR